MKKSFLVLLAVLMFPRVCWGQMIWDIIYHSIPFSSAFEFLSEAVAVGKMGVQQAGNVAATVTQAKTEATNIQSSVRATFNKIVNTSILSESLNGNAGDVQGQFFGKNLNKVKTKKIAKKFKKVFMTYDSFKGDDIQFVNDNREKFFQQNLIAVNAASTVLLAKLANEIKPKIKEAQECAGGNGTKCGIPPTNEGGKNEVWFAYANTLEQYDRLIKMMETVAALKARMTAISAMMVLSPVIASEAEKAEDDTNNGQDVPDDKTAEKSDKITLKFPLKAVGYKHTKIETAFAQVMSKSPIMSLSGVETQVKIAETPAEKMIDSAIEFVAPEEPQSEHPLLANEEKLETLNEITDLKEKVDTAMEAHNFLGELKSYHQTAQQVKEIQDEYNKALKKLRASEQCALNYFARYFKNPVQAWSGINLIKNVERHDLRKGISGWAVEAFETAKAAETSNVTTNDIEQYSMEDEEAYEDADDPDLSKTEQKTSKIKVSLSPGKIAAAEQETRHSFLVSWQIGAEASKILGKDPSQWGTPTGKSMIWTDTKRFYQQYLQRKYENIKAYLQRYTKEDIVALAISKLKNQKVTIEGTNYQKQRREIEALAASERQNEIKKMKISMQEYDKEVSAQLESLLKKRKNLVERMDKVNAEIKEAGDNLADMRQVAEDKASQQTEEQLLPEIRFPDHEKNKEDGSTEIPQLIDKEETQNLTLYNNTITLDQKKKELLQKGIEENKAILEEYNKQLEALDEQIDVAKLEAQAKKAGLNEKTMLFEKIKEAAEQKYAESNQKYASDIGENLDIIFPQRMGKDILLTAAEKSLKDINTQVSLIVDASYQQMLALGDNLYKPATHEKLVEIHRQMLNQIKKINLVYEVAGIIKFEEIAVLAELLSADTSAETEGFFVGADPKERDLRAPYKIPNFDLPPVREVFHFDVTDFKSIKPRNEKITNRNLTAAEFLNFGGDIPKIWQYMLKEDSFIESQYNLKNALNGGCENIAFARGGIMPCVVQGSKIVMDVNEKGNYIIRTDLEASSLPQCLLVDLKKKKPHHMLLDTPVVFYTLQQGIVGGMLAGTKATSRDCEYSELGMLLDADENNNLSFKPLAYDSYMTLLEKSGNKAKKLSDKEKNNISAANHAILSRNQIGDFLHHVEEETNARKNKEEAEQQYEDQKEELKQKFQRFGYTPTENFDLMNEGDYENAVLQIKLIKNRLIAEIKKEMSVLNMEQNEPVQQQKAFMEKLLNLMEKDREGNLNISDISADISNPEEELKKAKADSSVVDKLKNSLKEKQKEYTDIDQVFCANYGE